METMRELFYKGGYTFACESQGTRYGFRHLCFAFKNGQQVASAKCCYYNRTWERWTFESVLNLCARKLGLDPFTDQDRFASAA